MKRYNHLALERKWQKEWGRKKLYKAQNGGKQKKMYVLDMFPYPSGAGLHVGHPRGYIASDVYARMKRMQGYNVLHPMGFDSFGLPSEQYAIQTGKHPGPFTEKLVKRYKEQLSILGFSYDWNREVATHRPDYYKWTQWIFLKLYGAWYDLKKNTARPIKELIAEFKKNGNKKVIAVTDATVRQFSAKEWKALSKLGQQNILMKYRLAYEGEAEVNWCEELGTVLANDEVVDGPNGTLVSERGGYPVEKKKMRQWFLRISAYAERLLQGLEEINWSPAIKEIQRNWIGKSEGSEIPFILSNGETVTVFTTRADTLFGATYLVLAPEHKMVEQLRPYIRNWLAVEQYIKKAVTRAEADRTATEKEKTGVVLDGVTAINPVTKEQIPVWIADYVLAGYGTGAVMAVPAHDERDFAFAKKYNLPIREVVLEIAVPKGEHEIAKSNKGGLAVITRKEDKKILLQFEKKWSQWRLPGGSLEGNETPEEGVIREVLEETGYDAIIVKPLGSTYVCYEKFTDNNKIHERRAYGFVLEIDEVTKKDAALDDNEIVADLKYEWVEPRKAIELMRSNRSLMGEAELVERYLAGKEIFVENGILVDSGNFSGLFSEEARRQITKAVGGKLVTKYKMRDAIFARQRYWGEPIPLVHQKDGTIEPLPEKKLPLKLPNVKSYQPSGTGEGPLARVKEWIQKGYETNTMPGWAASSWYFLRYMDPKNKKVFAAKQTIKYWKNVDVYVGGTEHATGHLLYARFWHKFLFDLGLVFTKEPFQTLKNQGLILGPDNRKMSKRWGNVVNPDDVVKTYGADTLRVFESFIGPFEASLPWSTEGIIGSRRFIERVWKLAEKMTDKKGNEQNEKLLHKTIKKVSEDIESFNFNTAISAMMIFVNEAKGALSKKQFMQFLQLLAPFAPHITEELWQSSLGQRGSIHTATWPKWDAKKIAEESVTIVVQVNGKVRGQFEMPKELSQKEAEKRALALPRVQPHIAGKKVKKVIVVPGRVVNIVV